MPASSPQDRLTDRRLLLGVSGSIAAYKSAFLVRLLKKAGAAVQVLMTPDATRFISPLTLGTLSEREVLTAIFPDTEDDAPDDGWTKHVSLGRWADLFVIAPATAQTMAKLAHGFSDSMLTATALSAPCPVLVCPAMDRDMYQHPATRRNMELLADYDYHVLPAEHGELASGLVGPGRLPEPETIVEHITKLLDNDDPHPDDALAGMDVLVTAGPTQEPIDPVRIITNHSTGTMGYALAAAAARRGARVTLVSGPTQLDTPPGVTRIDVTTAEEMHAAVQQHAGADLVLMAAAVADYTPAAPASSKIKKGEALSSLDLRRTPDILKALGDKKRPGQTLVGFAMETDDGLANARRKLKTKNLDWIALNNLNDEGAGFGPGTNRITLIGRDGTKEALPQMPKQDVAHAILDYVTAARAAPTAS